MGLGFRCMVKYQSYCFEYIKLLFAGLLLGSMNSELYSIQCTYIKCIELLKMISTSLKLTIYILSKNHVFLFSYPSCAIVLLLTPKKDYLLETSTVITIDPDIAHIVCCWTPYFQYKCQDNFYKTEMVLF